MDQKELFLREEGGAWFKRNRSAHGSLEGKDAQEDIRYICDVLNPFRQRIDRILEIGCSSGLKLEVLCRTFEASGMGIDPSALAIADGKAHRGATDLDLRVGTGDDLPCESASFDLVYLAFCLYLTDRSLLLKTVAEADRVLKPGGFLAITDFDPGSRYRRSYSHVEGAFSYKQDYTRPFLESGHYYLAGKHCFSHRYPRFDEDSDERVATSILYRDPDAYPTRR
jgi:SAM-dependent methyltransferase